MIKTSLRADKARELARELGIIPHPGSQWKWALRKLRPHSKNPRALAKAKEALGKLPNNLTLKIRSAQRKARLNQEVGLTGTKVTLGDINSIKAIKAQRAHTHPDTLTNLRKKRGRIMAEPSGLNLDYKPELAPYFKKELERHTEYLKTLSYKDKRLTDEMLKNLNLQRRVYRGLEADAAYLKSRGRVESILSKGIEGVHKYREKLPLGIRSVYFKGGL